MAKFTVHSIEFNFVDETGTGMASPVVIGAITSASHPLNTETRGDESGGIYDEQRAIVSQLPEPAYSTKSIQRMMSICGALGQCFSSDGTHPGVRVYGQIVRDCQNNPAATDNIRYTIPAGLILPQTLSVDRTGDAVLSFMIHALSVSGNAPFSVTQGGVTLPSSPNVDTYGMGASRVGNVLWTEPLSYNLAFGLTIADKLPALASIWPESVGVRKSQPVLTLGGRNPLMLGASAIPLLGKEITHANTLIQFVKRSKVGYVAAATEEHFALTMAGLAVVNDPFSASGDAEAQIEARAEGEFDGTNAPIVPLFDQAYSADAT